MKAGHRYNAACAAAQAGSGLGRDAIKLKEDERTRLRTQALDWLRADLELWSRRLKNSDAESAKAARMTIEHWLRDTDLAGVRESDALGKLSAAEQETWRKLWADVAALLKMLPAAQ
jgi:hypothetical protein